MLRPGHKTKTFPFNAKGLDLNAHCTVASHIKATAKTKVLIRDFLQQVPTNFLQNTTNYFIVFHVSSNKLINEMQTSAGWL